MKPYSNSSRLTNKARILKKSGKTSDWGNPMYESVGVCWCDVKDRAGGEVLLDSQNKKVSTAKTTFTFRLTPITAQITPDARIQWRDLSFSILSGPIYSDDRAFVSFEAERKF